jgi:hypothetical protein
MEKQVTTKAELLADIERDWDALQERLGRLTETEMTTLTNA